MKPRICIFYENHFGRNDGPPLFWFNVMKNQLKLDVWHLAPHGSQKEITQRFGKFDLHIWVDWGEDGLPWTEWEIPKDGGKTLYVVSDAHIGDSGKKYRFEKAMGFDYVFFNQKRAFEEYNTTYNISHVQPTYFVPHATEPAVYKPFPHIPKYDVCFIGHIQNQKNYNGFSRIDALDRLFKEFPNFYYGSRNPAFPEINLFEDVAKKFSMSKIVFNISITDDINMRVFEALSTKSFLLTNYIPTLGDLFQDGKHLVMYKTLNEMVGKAKFYLKYPDQMKKIAEAGYKECLAKHSYRHRVEKALDICLKYRVSFAPTTKQKI